MYISSLPDCVLGMVEVNAPPPHTHTQTYPRFYVPLICRRVFSKEFWQDVKQSVKMSITQRYPQTQSSPSPPPPFLAIVVCELS